MIDDRTNYPQTHIIIDYDSNKVIIRTRKEERLKEEVIKIDLTSNPTDKLIYELINALSGNNSTTLSEVIDGQLGVKEVW